MSKIYASLGEVCRKGSSNIAQKDLDNCNGDYPIYGASGFIKNVDFFQQEQEYIAIVKDGAGIGRTMKLPAKSSIIGTMQYIIPNETVDISYLYYAISSMNLSKYFSGATIPHIYYRDYQKERIPLTLIGEQKKIANTLESVEKLIEVRKKQLLLLSDLVKSRFIEMFGDQHTNQKNLPVVTLGSLFTVGSSKRIYQNEQVPNGIPFLRISDLTERIASGYNRDDLFIPIERYESLKNDGLVPNPGDILVTSRGTLGQCYVITDNDNFYFQDGMISWLSDMNAKVTVTYITQLFQMQGFRKQIDEVPAGSTVNYLSIARLKNLKVMLPNVNLQNEFTAFVAQVDKSKFEVQKGLEKLEILKKSLMQEYFG